MLSSWNFWMYTSKIFDFDTGECKYKAELACFQRGSISNVYCACAFCRITSKSKLNFCFPFADAFAWWITVSKKMPPSAYAVHNILTHPLFSCSQELPRPLKTLWDPFCTYAVFKRKYTPRRKLHFSVSFPILLVKRRLHFGLGITSIHSKRR